MNIKTKKFSTLKDAKAFAEKVQGFIETYTGTMKDDLETFHVVYYK